jgi:hypothetical protein
MNRAEQMKSALSFKKINWTELLIEAEEVGNSYEQDFKNEITYFEFSDGSVAAFHGKTQDILVYNSKN